MTREREGITQVAPGVLRVHRAAVNFYLVESADGLILIDAGLPGMWRTLARGLAELRARPEDITAVLLTHGHFDHVGLSERLRSDHRVASHVHPADRHLARRPYSYRPQRARFAYPFRHPGSIPVLARMTAAGALWVKGTKTEADVTPGVPMELPGRPVPVFSPGHTDGHCGFLLPERGVLFSGDALVTLDPYTGRTAPRLVARAATSDAETNLLSLETLAATDARVVLPGHGAPYGEGIRSAVAAARRAGVA